MVYSPQIFMSGYNELLLDSEKMINAPCNAVLNNIIHFLTHQKNANTQYNAVLTIFCLGNIFFQIKEYQLSYGDFEILKFKMFASGEK